MPVDQEPLPPGLKRGADGRVRCAWAGDDPLYQAYHDEEWGRPVHDDDLLFQKLSLEVFQSGLAWITVLRKRERFREVFAGFKIDDVARFGDPDIARLMNDPGIIRNRRKIEATINNARALRSAWPDPGGFASHVWTFAPAIPNTDWTRCESPESYALAKDLKQRGFRFVGPTNVYSFMQAMGLVNDHAPGCWCHEELT